MLLKYSRKPEKNTTHGRVRRIEGGDRQEGTFPRIKEILGFLKRQDSFAKHAQGVFQVRR